MKFLFLPFIIFLTLIFSCNEESYQKNKPLVKEELKEEVIVETKKQEQSEKYEEVKKRVEKKEIISKMLIKGNRSVILKIEDENKYLRNVLKRGNHVDIIGLFDDSNLKQKMVMTLLENVIILDINSESKNNFIDVSFLMLPQEAEILLLAQKIGKLSFTLRNEDDLSLLEEKGRVILDTILTTERSTELQEIRRQTIQKTNFSAVTKNVTLTIEKGGRGYFIKLPDENKYLTRAIKAGDVIDITGVFIDPVKKEKIMLTILEQVIVLGTDESFTIDKSFSYSYFLLYLLPQEAELLALARELGELDFTLRNQEDLSLLEEKGKITLDTIFTGDRTMELQEIRRQTIQKVKIIRGGEGNYTPKTNYLGRTYNNEDFVNDGYENEFKSVQTNPLSTFSIDVDTGAYSQIRNAINKSNSIDRDIVRIEEMINYFDYEYTIPENEAFSVNTEVGQSLFDKNKHIISIGIQGIKKEYETTPPANLVFLIDVSGSMDDEYKLKLLKRGLLSLINDLKDNDKISIITYADGTNVVLNNISGKDKEVLKNAIESLNANGSTNGEGGIQKAYETATNNFIKGGINRILLCTDGDFNVGVQNVDELKNIIKEKRKSGVSLSTIGFGQRGSNDELMEQIADAGNGNYSYIDSYNEMVKVLSTELTSTFDVIAKDVKIQVEFNPDFVESYRLIGYKNRMLKSEDFNNDEIDAGEIGAGHKVTALYEIVFNDRPENKLIDELKYQKLKKSDFITYISDYKNSGEFAEVKVRYKKPDENKSNLVKHQLYKKDVKNDISKTSNDFKFAVSVAAFGQYLLKSEFNGSINLNDIISLATEGKGTDKFGYREEFIQLLKKYKY